MLNTEERARGTAEKSITDNGATGPETCRMASGSGGTRLEVGSRKVVFLSKGRAADSTFQQG